MFEALAAFVESLMTSNSLGFILGLALGSSVLPLPSESLLLGMGLTGMNPVEAAVYGGIGSTIGATIAYYIGKAFGRKFVEKIGKYFFLTERALAAMDEWAERFGSAAVLVSRLIPIVPHKIFSIFAGVSKINFKNFLLLTLIGSVPRCFLLVYFGNVVSTSNIWLIAASFIAIFAFPLLFTKVVDLARKH